MGSSVHSLVLYSRNMATSTAMLLLLGLSASYVMLSQSASCKDRSRYCSNYLRAGYCDRKYLIPQMKIYCQQSCKFCVTTTVATTTTARKRTRATDSSCFGRVKYCSLVKRWGNCKKDKYETFVKK